MSLFPWILSVAFWKSCCFWKAASKDWALYFKHFHPNRRLSGNLLLIDLLKVTGGLHCYDFWCETCLTISHCMLEVGKLWNESCFFDPCKLTAGNQAPYGNNLQPTLALSGSVTTTHTIATLEGYLRTTMMNDYFMWNQPTSSKVSAL